jgi:hypothetical protein
LSFVAVQGFIAASLLPAAWGCADSGRTSTFETGDAASDGERIYSPPPPWSGGTPVQIETGEQALSLALDSSEVYWQNPGGSLFACPLDGCPSSKPTLLSSLIGPGAGDLETLGVGNGIAVFLTDYGNEISSFTGADSGHSPTSYRTTTGRGFGSLVTDPTYAYFIDTVLAVDGGYTYTSTLYSCPLVASCSSPESLYVGAADASLGPLFAADSEVYFVEVGSTNAIRAVPIHGGTVRTVCESSLLDQTQAICVAGGNAYFTTAGEPTSIYQCAASGGSDPSIYIQDLQPYALASDGANMYWTNYVFGPGSVVTCPLGVTCTSPLTVASNQDDPLAISANVSSVYWATDSNIYRADK